MNVVDFMPDLLYTLCYQLPLEFQNLGETRRHRIQWGDWLLGLCCDDDLLYCTERCVGDNTYWLAVYNMSKADDGSLELLDKVNVGDVDLHCRPRVDSGHRVYVPCGRSGVRIFHCQDGRLLPARDPVKCVKNAISTCVNTADTLLVGDWDTSHVYLVNVSTESEIRRLQRPAQVQGHPYQVSVFEQRVLVCYGNKTLVTYRSDSLTPARVLQTPEGLGKVSSITSDSHSSNFLVTGYSSVYVLDNKLLWHRIYTGSSILQDCAVVQSQLWLGDYFRGGIAVLKSQ